MSAPRTLSVATEKETLIVMPLHSVGSFSEEDIKPELDALLAQLQPPEPRNVVIDLAKVPYFGTALLKAIHAVWRRVGKLEGKMALCNVSDMGREVLRVSKFDTLWPVCASRAEAMAERSGLHPPCATVSAPPPCAPSG